MNARVLKYGTTLTSFLFFLLPPVMIGCVRKEVPAPEIHAKLAVKFNPDPPVIGKNHLEITVTDPNGKPLQLGKLKVEGNMNHAGMRPEFTDLMEGDPGRYSGTIDFTMGGDWFLMVTSEASPEGVLNQKINVPGVKAK